jgi:hypothetical protein
MSFIQWLKLIEGNPATGCKYNTMGDMWRIENMKISKWLRRNG